MNTGNMTNDEANAIGNFITSLERARNEINELNHNLNGISDMRFLMPNIEFKDANGNVVPKSVNPDDILSLINDSNGMVYERANDREGFISMFMHKNPFGQIPLNWALENGYSIHTVKQK